MFAIDFKTYLFTLSHIISLPISVLSRLRFISWSSPSPSLFHWPRAQLYLSIIYTFWSEVLSIAYYVLDLLNVYTWIYLFGRYSEGIPGKIIWYLSKGNKKVKTERVSNWIDAQPSCFGFTSFNVFPCLLPKMTDKLLL